MDGSDRARRQVWRPDADTLVLGTGLAVSVLVSIWLTWGIWGTGVPAGDDTAAHVVRAEYAMEHFFSAGGLDGWQSSFGLGYQQFLFIGPGFSLLVATIQALTLGTMSALTATKVATVISFALVPLSVAFLAWAFGLGRRAAGVAAVLALAVSSAYGGAGLASVFGSGLLPNLLGSALLGFAFGGVVLVVRRPSVRRIVFAAAMAAALVATHPIAAIVLGFLSTALVLAAGTEWFAWNAAALGRRLAPWLDRVAPAPDISRSPTDATGATDAPDAPDATDLTDPTQPTGRWLVTVLAAPVRRLAALAMAGTLAIGMAGFVLVPLLAHGDLRGENSAWSDVALGPRLVGIWRGEFLYRPWVALVVVAGFVFVGLLAIGRRRGALTLLLTPVVYLVLARAFITLAADNIVAIQLTNRSIANVGLLAVLPLATLLAAPRGFATRVALATGAHPRPDNPATHAGDALVPVVLALLVVLVPSGLDRDTARVVTPTPSLEAMADQLHALVPEGARFATQRLPARERDLTGMSHPDLWLAWATGANTLNIYNLESSVVFEPVYEAEHLTDRPPDAVAARLSRLGVSHLALLDPAEAADLTRSPAFATVWTDGSMAILAVLPDPGQPSPAGLLTAPVPAEAVLVRADPQHLVIEAATVQPTTATVAVAWSPKWRAAVNGRPVATGATADKLLQLPLPGGPAQVTLDYGLDDADLGGRALTGASLAVAIAALIGDRRRRTGSRSRADGADCADASGETAGGDPVSDAVTRATMGR